jgi:hypothetical protein
VVVLRGAVPRLAGSQEQAAATHAGDADFDDYTRAKGAFFDQVQADYRQTAVHHDAAGST